MPTKPRGLRYFSVLALLVVLLVPFALFIESLRLLHTLTEDAVRRHPVLD